MHSSFRFFLILIFSASFFVPGFSQDDHYWAQQYGAVSTLMGGAVVGGVRDNSAIFYNPGALSFIKFPNLSVDANVYKIDKIFIRDGAGTGINLNSMQFCIYPQIVSGLIRFKNWTRFKLGYAVLTRNYASILMNSRYLNTSYSPTGDTLLNSTVGSFDYTNVMNEQWFGAGAGYQLNDHLGIGVSLFVNYRTQTYELYSLQRQLAREEQNYGFYTSNIDESIKYKYFGILAKIGIDYEVNRWKFGLAITTPSIHVYGKGDVNREISAYQGSQSASDTAAGFIMYDYKFGTRAAYHLPFSVAAGVDWQGKTTRVSMSCEYFSSIAGYFLLKPESNPFIYPPGIKDTAIIREFAATFLQVKNSSKPVFNIGVGLEQNLFKNLLFLFGANTDFSSFKEMDEGDFLMHGGGSWDLYHLSTGLSYRTLKEMITLGFSYTFSPERNVEPYTNITVQNIPENAKAFAQSFGLVLGFTYFISKLGN